MKNKNVFMISLIVIIITVICMGINRFISPFSDIAVRVIGGIMLVDIFVLSYSKVKLKKQQ
ncbi:hypothetical protein [Clostridium estertheticum]|uniref:Uncharacterized protein n=1 Tax=Clostridium estertheticum TaxID=238834 RepID=A0A7Y3SZR7_9CLOT|nr:hypothetical protein [Clostridium estertheticum]MBW9154790.1 hypothetical protein [Clostridium estertheticum]MBW9172840.1 hypothetical protein [Clostridium estertheticum]MBX4262802.1 hypothetical protein [Clostridium estertheticum]MBX4265575.1 hypothetical protein [Clostridium estertheticum]MBX4271950.1 hypothetical protein [Clostridium estertheticum]